MTRDRWTLLIVGGVSSPTRQFTVSPRVARYAAGAIVAVVLCALGMSLATILWGADRYEEYRLRARNEALAAELESLQAKVGGLEGTLAELSRKDARLRLLAGLDSLDRDVLEVGVGGPGLAKPEANPLWAVDSTLGATAFAVSYDVTALERRARLLSESMSEAGDSLAAHRELLESTPSILPTRGLLSSRFAQRRWHPIHNKPLPHEGVDISAARGTPIVATAHGRVARAGWVPGYGRLVEIDHGHGFVTRYAHASRLLVRVGQEVDRGDAVAQVGSSGIATSSHVHYEVLVDGKPENPLHYVFDQSIP